MIKVKVAIFTGDDNQKENDIKQIIKQYQSER